MGVGRKEIEVAFSEVAALCEAAPKKTTKQAVDIEGTSVVLRVYWRIERLNKAFVTLRAKTPASSRECGLPYLVKFKNGPDIDFKLSQSGEITALVCLVKSYALPYLLNIEKDFAEFQAYTIDTVRQNTPPTPEITANRWIHPEWI